MRGNSRSLRTPIYAPALAGTLGIGPSHPQSASTSSTLGRSAEHAIKTKALLANELDSGIRRVRPVHINFPVVGLVAIMSIGAGPLPLASLAFETGIALAKGEGC